MGVNRGGEGNLLKDEGNLWAPTAERSTGYCGGVFLLLLLFHCWVYSFCQPHIRLRYVFWHWCLVSTNPASSPSPQTHFKTTDGWSFLQAVSDGRPVSMKSTVVFNECVWWQQQHHMVPTWKKNRLYQRNLSGRERRTFTSDLTLFISSLIICSMNLCAWLINTLMSNDRFLLLPPFCDQVTKEHERWSRPSFEAKD